MTQQWAQEFLSAVEQQISTALPVTFTSSSSSSSNNGQQTAEAASAPAAIAELPASVLIDLAYGIPFLSILPSRAWQSRFMLVLTGQLSSFSPAQAADMLNALAHWKAAVLSSTSINSSSSSSGGAVVPADPKTADMPLPLLDALMMVVASAKGLQPSGTSVAGRLGPAAIAALPRVLGMLSWPVDPLVVETCMRFVAEYQNAMVASRGKAVAALERCQQQLQLLEGQNSVAVPLQQKRGKKGKQSSKQQPDREQQRAQVAADVDLLQGMVTEADDMLIQVQEIGLEWEKLLNEGQQDTGIYSRSRNSSKAANLGDNSIVRGSSSGLDVEGLMGGMLSAAGVPSISDSAASSGMTSEFGVGVDLDAAISAGMELDDLLGVLDAASMLAEQQQVYDSEEHEQQEGDYIDTTAVDVTL